MTITVKAFAAAADACGFRESDFKLTGGDTVGDLVGVLVASYPGLGPMRSDLLVAVNEEYSGADRRLADGDVVAVFPPVSGG